MKIFCRPHFARFLGMIFITVMSCQKENPVVPERPNLIDSAIGLQQYLHYTFSGDSVSYSQNIDSFQVRISSPMSFNSLVCFRKNQSDSMYFSFNARWDLKEGYIENLWFKKNGVKYDYAVNPYVLSITKLELTEFGEKGFEDDKGGYIAGNLTTALFKPGTLEFIPLKMHFRFKRKY